MSVCGSHSAQANYLRAKVLAGKVAADATLRVGGPVVIMLEGWHVERWSFY
jgi:hypothetical protein